MRTCIDSIIMTLANLFIILKNHLEESGGMPVSFIIMQMMITFGNSEAWRLKQLIIL